ncbi:MAG: hypothetical protein QOJ07_1513 [Thermoleophilaceae bacterium]|nr:hypothetical protein [Thermoleophilaceae bacterium]
MLKTLADIGPSKLHAGEQDLLREATDALFFAEDIEGDDAARIALLDVQALCSGLVEAGRWLPETADALMRDVEGCGPLEPVASTL